MTQRERERERETNRDRDRHTQRNRGRETDRERQRQRERTDRDSQTETERETETERQREAEREENNNQENNLLCESCNWSGQNVRPYNSVSRFSKRTHTVAVSRFPFSMLLPGRYRWKFVFKSVCGWPCPLPPCRSLCCNRTG